MYEIHEIPFNPFDPIKQLTERIDDLSMKRTRIQFGRFKPKPNIYYKR